MNNNNNKKSYVHILSMREQNGGQLPPHFLYMILASDYLNLMFKLVCNFYTQMICLLLHSTKIGGELTNVVTSKLYELICFK